MGSFIVEGKIRLSGSIQVSGNKNEALPLIAASLLCSGPVQLSNVPEIGDVNNMLEIASTLGATLSPLKDGKVTIDGTNLKSSILPLELSNTIRASILFASSLLVRTGRAVICQPEEII